MAELVPPDEIYVPMQAAIDFDIFALEGVITNEHKYLLATPKRKAAPELHKITKMFHEWLSGQYNPSPMAIKSLMDGARETLAGLEKDK